jgi:hypothetical protein
MAIKNIVLRGFGNGTVTGTIPLVVLRGYGIGAAVITPIPSLFATLPSNKGHLTLPANKGHLTIPDQK